MMIHPLFFLSRRVRHRGTLSSSTEYVVGIAVVIIILSTLFLFGLSSFYNNTAQSTTWMKTTTGTTTITTTITTTELGEPTTITSTITSTTTAQVTTSAQNPMTVNWGPVATGIFIGLIGIAIAVCVLTWFMKLPNERWL